MISLRHMLQNPSGSARLSASIIIRALALILFTFAVYRAEYRPVQEGNFWLDTKMSAVIRAANVGKPFHFFPGDDLHPDAVDESQLSTWEDSFLEPGTYLLVSTTSILGRLVDSDYQVSARTPYDLVFALLVLTALVFLIPGVPLPLSLAGVLALGIGIVQEPIELTLEGRFWGIGYMALVVGMFVATIPLARKHIGLRIAQVLLSILIGFAPFLRQAGGPVPYATAVAIFGMIAIIGGVAFVVMQNRQRWWVFMLPFARQLGIPALMITLTTFAMPYIVRIPYVFYWDVPYSRTDFVGGSEAFPLYLGLGWVSNPYNIVWLDPVATHHVELNNPGTVISYTDRAFDPYIAALWRDTLNERPWLLVQNALEKARFIDHTFRYNELPYEPQGFLPNEHSDLMARLYLLAHGLLIALPLWIMRKSDAISLVVYTAFLAIAASASLAALLVIPVYFGGPQGVLLAFTLIMPMAVFVQRRQPTSPMADLSPGELRRITWGTLAVCAASLLILAAAMTAFLLIKDGNFQQYVDEAAAQEPLAAIQEMEFEYGHVFNSLEPRQQRDIIAALVASEDAHVALPQNPEAYGYFEASVAILSENQLHLIVWLGSDYPGPIEQFNQAAIHSLIQVCAGCTEITRNYGYNHVRTVYAWLNDSDWSDEYRMLSFAVDEAAFEDGGELLIVPQRLRGWGGNATDFHYLVDELTGPIFMAFDNDQEAKP